jgi:CheY-like chemotaxis protein
MSTKVLVADDSDIMRSAIRRTLQEEPRLEVVGETSSFSKTMQMIAGTKPEVLILDLHLAEKRDFTPAFVKSQLATVNHIVAVSFSSDDEAKDLARSYGASALLDKMKLYNELVPAIMRCSQITHDEHGDLTTKNLAIEGDSYFMLILGIVHDYAKQNRDAKLLARNIPIDTPYELLRESDVQAWSSDQTGQGDLAS